jgi:hypothetical protein
MTSVVDEGSREICGAEMFCMARYDVSKSLGANKASQASPGCSSILLALVIQLISHDR